VLNLPLPPWIVVVRSALKQTFNADREQLKAKAKTIYFIGMHLFFPDRQKKREKRKSV